MVVGKVGRAETSTDPAPVNMTETIIIFKPKDEWPKGTTKDAILRAARRQAAHPRRHQHLDAAHPQPHRHALDRHPHAGRSQGLRPRPPGHRAEVRRDRARPAHRSRRQRSLCRAHHRRAVSRDARQPRRRCPLRHQRRRRRGRDRDRDRRQEPDHHHRRPPALPRARALRPRLSRQLEQLGDVLVTGRTARRCRCTKSPTSAPPWDHR